MLKILASADPDLPLFEDEKRTVTAGDIRATATVIAEGLRPLAAPVYLHTASTSLFAAGLLAAASVGRPVACPAHVRPEYLVEIGAQEGDFLSDEPLNFGTAELMKLVRQERRNTRNFDHAVELDLLFYTSGVTGTPKLIRKNIGQLDAEAEMLESVWGSAAGTVHATVSHQHIYGMLFRLFWPVASGRISSDRAAEFWPQLAGKLTRRSTLVSSPAHLTRMPGADVFGDAHPGLIFSSGAPLPAAAAQTCATLLGSFPIEVLGSTETGGIAWRRQERADPVWTALPSVRVTADDLQRLNVTSPFTGEREPICTGDNVEFVGAGFVLKGRADRVAKIEGKRVSLVRVEEALLGNPLVKDAAVVDLPSRKGALGAIVELTSEGERRRAEDGSFRFSRSLRRSLAGRLEQAERPKYWRFGSIARNAQGKRVQSMIRSAFDVPPERYYGRGRLQAADDAVAAVELEIIPTLIWFSGHFPNEPVLAGLAQLHLAVAWGEQVWNWKPRGSNITRLKFRHVLRPGDKVLLELARHVEAGSLKFAYRRDGAVASEGTIGGER